MKRVVLVVLILVVLSFGFSQTSSLLVNNIQAQHSDNGEILVTWQLPLLPENFDTNQLSLLLYRTEEQKAGSNSLDDLSPIATLPFETISYTDAPQDEKEYYYTVIVILANQYYPVLVIPDRNSTVIGVRVQPQKQPSEEDQQESVQKNLKNPTGIRNTPLPYLKLPLSKSKDLPVNPERKKQDSSSSQSENEKKTSLPDYHIFRQELEPDNVGENFILQEIVNNHLKTGNYHKAEEALRDFLSINHSQAATDRGTFYLGEVLLYQGKYQQALSCFLKVQDRFPALSNRWIRATLNSFQLPITE